jgi:hypothetical protein
MVPQTSAVAAVRVATNTLTKERSKVLASAQTALIVQPHAAVARLTAVPPDRLYKRSKPP